MALDLAADLDFAHSLADAADAQAKLAPLRDATHVFYAARYDHPEGVPESVDINAAMLRNLLDAMQDLPALRHVHAVHGSKYYGHQIRPVALPMREEHPRAPGGNFYFDQEDLLVERSRGRH